MTIGEKNDMIRRAATKKDGVYSAHGYRYAVRDNALVGYGQRIGFGKRIEVYSCHGQFSVERSSNGLSLDGTLREIITESRGSGDIP